MSNKTWIKNNKYYFPICREKGCNGHLNISINEDNFSINCICGKNKNHIFNNIFFEIFEKLYLKENITQNCHKCLKNLDNKDKYKCIECKKIYCSSCFISDKHIQNNWKNLIIKTTKCLKDENQLTHYCLDCGEKVCYFCLKRNEENNPHKKHNIKNIITEIPSNSKIKELKEKIIKKAEAFDSLIKSLEEWQKELNNKMERIKKNLKCEIRILKKLFLNFNSDYVNYAHYKNFHNIFGELKNFNNKYFEQFMNCNNFQEKTKYISNLLTLRENEIIIKSAELKDLTNSNINGTLLNFTDDLLFYYSNSKIKLLKYDKRINLYIKESEIDIDEEIYSFNFSPDRKKIYICLNENKTVFIVNYNSINKTLELDEDKIELEEEGYFNKCIYINDNCIITSDNSSINLWSKKDLNTKNFLNAKKISFEDGISDICKVNDRYLCFSQNSKVLFLTIENLSGDKIINGIDCITDEKNLLLINDCILVNCKNGIAIISIKTKELIQYIENWDDWDNKIITKTFDNKILILETSGFLFEFNFFEYNLILISKTKFEEPNEEFIVDDIFINNNNIFICSDSIYKLKYDDKEDVEIFQI